jgi:hypothetical protein
MQVLEDTVESVTLQLSRDELRALGNALNEVCNGPDAIEAWEFPIRMGVTLDQGRNALRELLRPA